MRVLNKHRATPDEVRGAVYIGRPSKWGNPFTIGRDGTRAQVIEKYRDWLHERPELMAEAVEQLHGRDLVCFCAPLPCHGDVLLRIANPTPTPEATDG